MHSWNEYRYFTNSSSMQIVFIFLSGKIEARTFLGSGRHEILKSLVEWNKGVFIVPVWCIETVRSDGVTHSFTYQQSSTETGPCTMSPSVSCTLRCIQTIKWKSYFPIEWHYHHLHPLPCCWSNVSISRNYQLILWSKKLEEKERKGRICLWRPV